MRTMVRDIRFVLLASICILFLVINPMSAPSNAANEICSNGYSLLKDLPYSDKPECLGDLYLPKQTQAKLRSAVVFVHGGGWEGGDKKDDSVMAEALVDNGFVVFNINYRLLSAGGNFPADVVDVREAITFLADHSRNYGIDRKKIACMGTSAGGHLALMAAYASGRTICRASEAIDCPPVCAVVSWSGPTDLNSLRGGLIDRYLANAGAEAYRKASPISFVSTAVPTLLVHGDSDDLVPVSQSKRLYLALQSAHKDAEYLELKGEGHGFEAAGAMAFEKTIEFLRAHL
jgi:acetyl esterase/lipase